MRECTATNSCWSYSDWVGWKIRPSCYMLESYRWYFSDNGWCWAQTSIRLDPSLVFEGLCPQAPTFILIHVSSTRLSSVKYDVSTAEKAVVVSPALQGGLKHFYSDLTLTRRSLFNCICSSRGKKSRVAFDRLSLRPFLCKSLGSESAPSAEFIPQVKPDVQFHPAGQFRMAGLLWA